MKYKTFMTLHSIALAYFGLGTLFFPVLFWQTIYGVQLGGDSTWVIRVLGITILGNMAMTWASRNMDNNPGRMAIMITFSVEWLVYAILSLWGQLAGVFGILNWSNVVVALLFSFGLFQLRNNNLDE